MDAPLPLALRLHSTANRTRMASIGRLGIADILHRTLVTGLAGLSVCRSLTLSLSSLLLAGIAHLLLVQLRRRPLWHVPRAQRDYGGR